MAAPTAVTAGSTTYEVVEDVEVAFDAIASGSVTDDVTGRAPRALVSVQAGGEGLIGKYLDAGVWCVACDLDRFLPGYPANAQTFDVVLSAPGYRTVSLTVTIPAGATIPLAAGAVQLRPLPVRLQGRVTRSTLDPSPVAGAIVRVADRPGQALASLRTALHGAHALGTSVAPVDVSPTGTERTLTAPAESGAQTVALDDVTGLAGLVVGFDWQHELELAAVEAVDAAASTVELAGPLTRTYPNGTVLKQFDVTSPPGPPPTRMLVRAADAGDGLLVLDGPVDPATAAVQVDNPATPQVEYVALGALADADGFYAFEGIGGIETIDLRARETPPSPEGPRFSQTLDYGRLTNVVNVKLAP